MAMKAPSLLFPLLLLLLLAAAAARPSSTASDQGKWDGRSTLGGYRPIGNVNDPHVRELGQFAVDEHNRQSAGQSQLAFSRVVSGQQQVVAGMNYNLLVEAQGGGGGSGGAGPSTALYEAMVYERPAANVRTLLSFLPKAGGKKTSPAN
ncbi:hypothetical protein Taro_031139 [Colocasia esculenta]|uniref:Cystatin domain-containing protein n=1 Tax=Colocasia esculenta TaxID=4460 RepID=A0A843W290_COLES|nr:hypothetical protein [Colocasia esculenta]